MPTGKLTTTTSLSGGINTGDHATLKNRAEADQHPISAITGLQEALSGDTSKISALDKKIDSESNKARLNETQLAADIVTTAKTLETTIASSTETEKVRAERAEIDLNSKIISEKDARVNADAILENKIKDETNRAQAEEKRLIDIATEAGKIAKDIVNIIEPIKVSIKNEITDRIAGDKLTRQTMDAIGASLSHKLNELRDYTETEVERLEKEIAANKKYTDEEIKKLDEKIKEEIDPKLKELAEEIEASKRYTDAEITKLNKKINDEIDPKLAQLAADIDNSKKYTDDEIKKLNEKINDEIDPKLAKLATDLSNETERAIAADADINNRIDQISTELSLEAITTVTAERYVEEQSSFLEAKAFLPTEDYYKYDFISDTTKYKGTWQWKLFDPDMLIYNPRRKRGDLHPEDWIVGWCSYDYAHPSSGGKYPVEDNRVITSADIYDGWGTHVDADLNGIMYGWRFASSPRDDWPFFFDNYVNRTGWTDLFMRNFRILEEPEWSDNYSFTHYLKKYAVKLSDDLLPYPIKEPIKAWQKVTITEEEFLQNPRIYKIKDVKDTLLKLKKSTKYNSATNYFIKYNGACDSTVIRGTWLLDKTLDLDSFDYTAKGWYFFVNTEETTSRNIDTQPIFSGFIFERSSDGNQLLAKEYGTCRGTRVGDKELWKYSDTTTNSHVVYTKENGWVDERFRYVGIAQQYFYFEDSSEPIETPHYDYSLKQFVTTYGHKLSDEIIGKNYYTLLDFKKYLSENYIDGNYYKNIGQISEEEYNALECYEYYRTEKEKVIYKDIVRFAIETNPNKDTIIRSATGTDVIKVIDNNAVVNGYFPLAPEVCVNRKTGAEILLENGAEITLNNLKEYLVMNVPESVKHGYCSSVVLIIPGSIDSLPYRINNLSSYEIQMMQSGNIIDSLELFGDCQYNLLFMCNGVKLELYIQEIPLG